MAKRGARKVRAVKDEQAVLLAELDAKATPTKQKGSSNAPSNPGGRKNRRIGASRGHGGLKYEKDECDRSGTRTELALSRFKRERAVSPCMSAIGRGEGEEEDGEGERCGEGERYEAAGSGLSAEDAKALHGHEIGDVATGVPMQFTLSDEERVESGRPVQVRPRRATAHDGYPCGVWAGDVGQKRMVTVNLTRNATLLFYRLNRDRYGRHTYKLGREGAKCARSQVIFREEFKDLSEMDKKETVFRHLVGRGIRPMGHTVWDDYKHQYLRWA